MGGGAFDKPYNNGDLSGQTPSFILHYDRGTSIPVGPGVLGIGGYFGFKTSWRNYETYYDYLGTRYYYTQDYRWTYWMVGLRGTYHWNTWHNNDKLDTYAGVTLGYNIVSFKDRTDEVPGLVRHNYPGSAFRGGAFVGVKYYLAGGFGVFAEAGPTVAFIQGGLTFKF
ncbi:MAG: hypothetical protein H6594_04420 [Flavobacteriales bacterium]|nr:hypothetical protein [Flavobacteriales bacterium]